MKKITRLFVVVVLILVNSIIVFAGTNQNRPISSEEVKKNKGWEQDSYGWKWNPGDYNYPKSTWYWCDGNKDNVSECYYFDSNGYCLLNTITPDGYQVNEDGAWVENGTVQTKIGPYPNVPVSSSSDTSTNNASAAVTSTTPISDPLSDDFGGFCFAQNSVDGVKVDWRAKNLSGKTINYYTLYFTILNPVGDFCYDQITGYPLFSKKYVGPIKPNETLSCFSVIGYTSAPATVCLYEIDIEYADGSKEEVKYKKYTSTKSNWIL